MISQRRWAAPLSLVFVALAGVVLASCFSDRRLATDALPANGDCKIPVSSPAVGTVIIFIRNFAFIPQQVSIKRGTKVTWVNCDDPGTESHSSSSDVGIWDSPLLTPGDFYSRTFNDPTGTVFPYHCVPHPFMTGTVNID